MTSRLFFTDDALTADVDVLNCTPHADGFAVILNATPFHPQGGGQPSDTGWIDNSEVQKVFHEQDRLVHIVKQPVQLGKAQARVDEARRHLNARLHSAGHLIGVCGERAGWIPTKAHHWPGECRVSFTPSDNAQPLCIGNLEAQLEQWISADLPRVIQINADQRLIGFGELPSYPCGGTHVSSLKQLQAVPKLCISEKKGVLTVRYQFD
ncbi:alanyl-tRNA editing protein [Pseudomonas sp. SIMBA_077]